MTAGDIYTVAGLGGTPFCSRRRARRRPLEMTAPFAVTADAAGDVVITDTGTSNLIRFVPGRQRHLLRANHDRAHDIYTVAGDSTSG